MSPLDGKEIAEIPVARFCNGTAEVSRSADGERAQFRPDGPGIEALRCDTAAFVERAFGLTGPVLLALFGAWGLAISLWGDVPKYRVDMCAVGFLLLNALA